MPSVEDRFQAAVNVIKGLPKNGPYQPSTSMMLKFYGYYKQATEGPCAQKKPAFWDVVGKAKWDAWNSNRHLTKQQAMCKYVEDLREIIETMSFTENVADFVGSISGLDNINLDELDMIAPGMREIAESHPNSPFNSRTNSPQHGASSNASAVQDDETPTSSAAEAAATKLATMNGHLLNDISNSNFETTTGIAVSTPVLAGNYAISNGTVDQSDDEYADPVDMHHDLSEALLLNSELLKQIQATVLRMNADLVSVNQRMTLLERGMQDVRTTVQQRALKSVAGSRTQRWPRWWPFDDISPSWFLLLIVWPFMVNRLSKMLLTQRKK